MKVIYDRLLGMRDAEYADFQAKLTPGVEPWRFIGVRTPQLRALAKDIVRGKADGIDAELTARFLAELPHEYFDENQLHAFIISEIKEFNECVAMTEAFLPYVNNWATCDQLSPKVFAKKKGGRLVYGAELLRHIDRWLCSDETYTVRFGIGMLLAHYLDGDFDPAWMDRVAEIRSGEYYINMMIAWYFATSLAKQWDAAHDVLIHNRLDEWTHNKTIQKAVESRRITDEQKAYLRTLKRK
jgi:3-methyladenine DNA glycosylase AlkD